MKTVLEHKFSFPFACTVFIFFLACALPQTAFADSDMGPYRVSEATAANARYVGEGDAGVLEVYDNVTIVGMVQGSNDAAAVINMGNDKIHVESNDPIVIEDKGSAVLSLYSSRTSSSSVTVTASSTTNVVIDGWIKATLKETVGSIQCLGVSTLILSPGLVVSRNIDYGTNITAYLDLSMLSPENGVSVLGTPTAMTRAFFIVPPGTQDVGDLFGGAFPFSITNNACPVLVGDTTVGKIDRSSGGTITYTESRSVTFKDWKGDDIGAPQTVYYGFAAVAPTAPAREGYIFIRWDKDFLHVTENLVVTAEYAPLHPSQWLSGNVYTKGSNQDLALSSEHAFDAGVKVFVDGVEVPSPDVSLSEGSTVVTLTASYLESLSLGSYAIELRFADMSMSNNSFQVAAAQPSDDPKPLPAQPVNGKELAATGDAVPAGGLLIGSGFALLGLVVACRKTKGQC